MSNLLCGLAPYDGGTTTLIKEVAGCLFDLNEAATVEAVEKNKREQRKT
jgi:hypothetical protein